MRLQNAFYDYSIQYCEMYKDRSGILGKEIEKYGKSLGYKRVSLPEENKDSFIVGCITFKSDRHSVAKELHKVTQIDSVPESIKKPVEYFLEDHGMERIALIVPEEEKDTLVSGTVVGAVGKKKEGKFFASRIIKPIESYKEESRNKKVNYKKGNAIIVPNIQQVKDREEYLRILNKCRITEEDEVYLLEGLKHKKRALNEILKKEEEAKVFLIPGRDDYVSYMIPYLMPSRVLLGVSDRCNILSSPGILTISGKQILFCNYLSIKSILYCVDSTKPRIEKYFDALKSIIVYRHTSPLSPDMCPTYPNKKDPFVLQSIPDAVVLRVDEAIAEVRQVTLSNVSVALVILSEIRHGVCLVKEEEILIQKTFQ